MAHIGLGVVPGERSLLHENERNNQERSHLYGNRTNAENEFLKILEQLLIERT